MSTKDQLIGFEHDCWNALTSSSDDARAFYRKMLADDVVMQFPGGMVMTDRDAIIDSFKGDPWKWYRMDDERVTMLSTNAGIVSYSATTERGDGDKYEALMSTGYTKKKGEWKLAFHQQTPVA